MFEIHLESTITFGPNQFAYRRGRGCRDALALMLLDWISAFNNREKVALYSSDVSGAFDRVSRKRLIKKLENAGVHFRIINVLTSWLGERCAKVIVGGEESDDFIMNDMVYQGTVLGPILWNLFFGDARRAIQMLKFVESVFADDLHACRVFRVNVPNRSYRNVLRWRSSRP